jgi:hypothetical protein
VIKDRNLSRLLRAYPTQAETQLHRTPPVEAASNVEAVLSRFRELTDHPMGKAITLAVMLDQDECGERQLDPSTRDGAAQLFEEIFRNLASA